MLLRPPKGGLPDKSIPSGAMMLGRVPIYGRRDAGRRFWGKAEESLDRHRIASELAVKALFTKKRVTSR